MWKKILTALVVMATTRFSCTQGLLPHESKPGRLPLHAKVSHPGVPVSSEHSHNKDPLSPHGHRNEKSHMTEPLPMIYPDYFISGSQPPITGDLTYLPDGQVWLPPRAQSDWQMFPRQVPEQSSPPPISYDRHAQEVYQPMYPVAGQPYGFPWQYPPGPPPFQGFPPFYSTAPPTYEGMYWPSPRYGQPLPVNPAMPYQRASEAAIPPPPPPMDKKHASQSPQTVLQVSPQSFQTQSFPQPGPFQVFQDSPPWDQSSSYHQGIPLPSVPLTWHQYPYQVERDQDHTNHRFIAPSAVLPNPRPVSNNNQLPPRQTYPPHTIIKMDSSHTPAVDGGKRNLSPIANPGYTHSPLNTFPGQPQFPFPGQPPFQFQGQPPFQFQGQPPFQFQGQPSFPGQFPFPGQPPFQFPEQPSFPAYPQPYSSQPEYSEYTPWLDYRYEQHPLPDHPEAPSMAHIHEKTGQRSRKMDLPLHEDGGHKSAALSEHYLGPTGKETHGTLTPTVIHQHLKMANPGKVQTSMAGETHKTVPLAAHLTVTGNKMAAGKHAASIHSVKVPHQQSGKVYHGSVHNSVNMPPTLHGGHTALVDSVNMPPTLHGGHATLVHKVGPGQGHGTFIRKAGQVPKHTRHVIIPKLALPADLLKHLDPHKSIGLSGVSSFGDSRIDLGRLVKPLNRGVPLVPHGTHSSANVLRLKHPRIEHLQPRGYKEIPPSHEKKRHNTGYTAINAAGFKDERKAVRYNTGGESKAITHLRKRKQDGRFLDTNSGTDHTGNINVEAAKPHLNDQKYNPFFDTVKAFGSLVKSKRGHKRPTLSSFHGAGTGILGVDGHDVPAHVVQKDSPLSDRGQMTVTGSVNSRNYDKSPSSLGRHPAFGVTFVGSRDKKRRLKVDRNPSKRKQSQTTYAFKSNDNAETKPLAIEISAAKDSTDTRLIQGVKVRDKDFKTISNVPTMKRDYAGIEPLNAFAKQALAVGVTSDTFVNGQGTVSKDSAKGHASAIAKSTSAGSSSGDGSGASINSRQHHTASVLSLSKGV